jgi:hypothetical protein
MGEFHLAASGSVGGSRDDRGALGNISDSDVKATIGALPLLCAADATMIWTTRRAPDLTPVVRD